MKLCSGTLVFAFHTLIIVQLYFAGLILPNAQDKPSKNLIENCLPRLIPFCKEIKQKITRLIACIYSHVEKISRVCYLVNFTVSSRLKRAGNQFEMLSLNAEAAQECSV